MAPRVESFPPSQLSERIQYKPDGKRQKSPVDLRKCELREMIQYFCDLDGPKGDPKSKVVCEPWLRTFRRCANGLTVETTQWEGVHDQPATD